MVGCRADFCGWLQRIDGGLQALDDGAEILTPLASELVEKSRIGESADTVWRQLNGEHQRMFAARANLPVSEPLAATFQRESFAQAVPVLASGGRARGWKRVSARTAHPICSVLCLTNTQ